MSLKGFHIVFITFAILLALGCGVWCIWIDLTAGTTAYRIGAIGSFVAALALLIYGIWFYRKMKKLRLIT